MPIKTFLLILFLLFSAQGLMAKANKEADFLLKPDSTTSFMNYEFHNLALEAASKKNYEDAFRIYLKIANKGDERAEYNVGMLYMKGLGVERKKMDAYKWLRRASKHGNKEATLYFKQMNERYEKKHQKPKPAPTVKKADDLAVEDVTPIIEKNTSLPEKPVIKEVKVPQQTVAKVKKEESPSYIYIILAFVGLIVAIGLFFFKKSASTAKQKRASTSMPKNKSQMYDSAHANIEKYHTELLKYIDMSVYRDNKKKMQIYYMFLAGMIDYFCQLEKFSDSEQRRVFSSHMTKQEGKENLTAITQAILEGQRDHSMYHYQAAGGISAQAWYEEKSKDALKMLKKVMTEERT
jgi:Sel1 repeat-containing protein